jgi:hypothetical protein
MAADKAAKIEVAAGGRQLDCRVIDLSLGGACLECENPCRTPDRFNVVLDAYYTASCRVMWRDQNRVGVAFLH